MNSSATPFGLPDTAPDLARRFAMIMAGLAALVARRFVKMPHLSPFTLLLFTRLNRAVRRFHRALTTPGRMRAPGIRRHRADGPHPTQLRLPAGRGWIVRELGWEAAAFLLYLETLLADIDTQAALAAAPRTGRILRPICRMLGVPAALTPKMIPPTLTAKMMPAPQATLPAPQSHPRPPPMVSDAAPLVADAPPIPGQIFSGT